LEIEDLSFRLLAALDFVAQFIDALFELPDLLSSHNEIAFKLSTE